MASITMVIFYLYNNPPEFKQKQIISTKDCQIFLYFIQLTNKLGSYVLHGRILISALQKHLIQILISQSDSPFYFCFWYRRSICSSGCLQIHLFLRFSLASAGTSEVSHHTWYLFSLLLCQYACDLFNEERGPDTASKSSSVRRCMFIFNLARSSKALAKMKYIISSFKRENWNCFTHRVTKICCHCVGKMLSSANQLVLLMKK